MTVQALTEQFRPEGAFMNCIKAAVTVVGVSLAAVSFANAQTEPTNRPPASPPAATSIDKFPPLPGANSFTEAQAKERLARAGFTQVSNLKKDDQGIWRGNAMQTGKSVSVAVDFRGNIVSK